MKKATIKIQEVKTDRSVIVVLTDEDEQEYKFLLASENISKAWGDMMGQFIRLFTESLRVVKNNDQDSG